MIIVFCRDWADAADRTGEVNLHAHLIDFIRDGDAADIPEQLLKHFSAPLTRAREEVNRG